VEGGGGGAGGEYCVLHSHTIEVRVVSRYCMSHVSHDAIKE